MEKVKTGFWRGFTWKGFIIMTIFVFIIGLATDWLSDGINGISSYSLKKWSSKILTAFVLGFIFAVWQDPINDKSKSK